MKIIVTGGAGFIGSNFVHHMVNKYPDYEIIQVTVFQISCIGQQIQVDDLIIWIFIYQYGKYLKDVLDGKYVDKLHNREF